VPNNRNVQANRPGNPRPGNVVGVQKKPPNAAPNQYKVNHLAPKPNTAVVANRKPPVAGQAAKGGVVGVRSGPQVAKTGPQTVKSGPQAQKSGPVPVKSGQQIVKGVPQAGKPVGVANRTPNAPGFPVQAGKFLQLKPCIRFYELFA